MSTLFYFYIIYSRKLDRYYVGHTEDLSKRLFEHNNGFSKYTSKASDWTLKFNKTFLTRAEAKQIEIEVKRKKSRKYIEWLLENNINL